MTGKVERDGRGGLEDSMERGCGVLRLVYVWDKIPSTPFMASELVLDPNSCLSGTNTQVRDNPYQRT